MKIEEEPQYLPKKIRKPIRMNSSSVAIGKEFQKRLNSNKLSAKESVKSNVQ